MIMDLALIKILKIIHVNVIQIFVVDILLDGDLVGELTNT